MNKVRLATYVLLACFPLLTRSGSAPSTAAGNSDSPRAHGLFDLPQPDTSKLAHKKLWATYYHIWAAQEVRAGTPLFSASGKPLTGNLSNRDWCMSAIEGTVRLRGADGETKTYNFVKQGKTRRVDCASVLNISAIKKPWIRGIGRSTFRLANGEFGDGVEQYKLVPYRTIAVDREVIPYGTVIYIPSARGAQVELSSFQSVAHDGYFFAADRGGAINGNHIDVFAGTSRHNPFPDFIRSRANHTFDAFVVADQTITARLLKEHTSP